MNILSSEVNKFSWLIHFMTFRTSRSDFTRRRHICLATSSFPIWRAISSLHRWLRGMKCDKRALLFRGTTAPALVGRTCPLLSQISIFWDFRYILHTHWPERGFYKPASPSQERGKATFHSKAAFDHMGVNLCIGNSSTPIRFRSLQVPFMPKREPCRLPAAHPDIWQMR